MLTTSSVISNVTFDANGIINGSITTRTLGGVGPYTYTWNSGQLTANIVNVPAGTYTLTVKDAINATLTSSFTVATTLGVAFTHVDCSASNATNGSVTTSVYGGTSPLSFQWSNGSVERNLIRVPAGMYSLVVTDSAGLKGKATQEIKEPPAAGTYTSNTIRAFSALEVVSGGALYFGGRNARIMWDETAGSMLIQKRIDGDWVTKLEV